MSIKKVIFILILICGSTSGCIFSLEDRQFKRSCENHRKFYKNYLQNSNTEDPAKLLKEQQNFINDLKDFFTKHPQSIWADDANFIVAYLVRKNNNLSRKELVKELESLFEKYPNFHIEDWTRENIPPIVDEFDLSSPPMHAPKNISVDIHCQRLLKLSLFFQYRLEDEEKKQWLLSKEIIETPQYDYGYIDSSTDSCKRFFDDFRKSEWKKRCNKQKDIKDVADNVYNPL